MSEKPNNDGHKCDATNQLGSTGEALQAATVYIDRLEHEVTRLRTLAECWRIGLDPRMLETEDRLLWLAQMEMDRLGALAERWRLLAQLVAAGRPTDGR